MPKGDDGIPEDFLKKEFCLNKEKVIVAMQCLARTHSAKLTAREICRREVEQVYDSDYDRYFYYNSKIGKSSWNKPVIMGSEPMEKDRKPAIIKIQKMYRNRTDSTTKAKLMRKR
mmetsp:Transcript_16477/g.24171  ORF Transcript_16477/g.24171 Transcript_16477/m.24171 type:complete len:115 (+) Transcript_16477:274-618(+)|eukprot:CAMPEP_0195507902 /NCGR_PEP_ID=MMETSP0794_2-20130614/1250_1 /TAXON_ID=515487 /ORGANISM="Stephanopyxis turris, Strain CCMP 815" /LENGTH=114 /DNA_ID=CAMNT_0040634731 /DNA_START=244 /DNA_END=588 /DNA_ORIENTATION=-